MPRTNVVTLPVRRRRVVVAKVVRQRRSKRPAASIYQMRQRELAWLLYITEGYIANLEHALAVNCVTFEVADHDVVAEAIDSARQQADSIREALQTIQES